MRKPMVKLGFFVLLLVSFWSCKDITDQYLYKRPSWLEGKLYEQMAGRDDLNLFVQGVARTAYKDVLDRSGYFTVFAPTDDAMKAYLSEKGYASVDDIPVEVMEGIVRFHTLQNGWNSEQLKYYLGDWIDPENVDRYRYLYYKRSTIFEDSATWTRWGNSQFTGGVKKDYKVIPTSRKVIPLYYKEALELEDLTIEDYGLFTGRADVSSDDMYYGYAKVLESEIPAENGFIYTVDKVMEPMKTVRQYLENSNGESYSKFLALLDEFRYLEPDFEATNEQEGADLGYDIDTLYTSSYRYYNTNLQFNIDQEITFNGVASEFDLNESPSLFAPNDAAFNELMNSTLISDTYPHYYNLQSIPLFVKRDFLYSFMTEGYAMEGSLEKGVMSYVDDSINIETITDDNVAEKVICSNGYFVGLKKSFVPRMLSSITGPVVMRPEYSYYMYAIERARMFPALKMSSNDYTLFAVSDAACDRDSSFVISFPDPDNPTFFRFWEWNFLTGGETYFTQTDVKKRLKNHIAIGRFTSYDEGGASVQFLPTLGGNYIKYFERNDSAFAEGSDRSSERVDKIYFDPITGEDSTWRADEQRDIYIQKFDEPTDNGEAYAASNWFTPLTTTFYDRLKGFNKFIALMYKCGLASETYSTLYLNLSSSELCTGFIPSDAALEEFQADTITNMAVLRELLRSHFVRGEMIFTDGSLPSGDYQTLYSAATISIETGPDKLVLLMDVDDEFDDYDVILDNAEYDGGRITDNVMRDNLLDQSLRINILSSKPVTTTTTDYDYTAKAVTHLIEKVYVPEALKSYFYN